MHKTVNAQASFQFPYKESSSYGPYDVNTAIILDIATTKVIWFWLLSSAC